MNGKKLLRESAKAAYKKYSATFKKIKKQQASDKADKNLPKLGRKLTFSEWFKAVRAPSAFKTEPETIQEFKEEDLEW